MSPFFVKAPIDDKEPPIDDKETLIDDKNPLIEQLKALIDDKNALIARAAIKKSKNRKADLLRTSTSRGCPYFG